MRYKSFVLQKFINSFIKRGGKFRAMIFFTNLLSFLKKNEKNKPFTNILNILRKVKPAVLFIKIRRGSKPFYLPKLLNIENQYKQGIY